MSLIEELGSTLHSASAELPLGPLVAALDRLQATSALLMWIRTESTRPLGVPQLTSATEHLEQAGRAMQVAQEAIATYLSAVGLHFDAQSPTEHDLGTLDGARDGDDLDRTGGPDRAGDPNQPAAPDQRDPDQRDPDQRERDQRERDQRERDQRDPDRPGGPDQADKPGQHRRPEGAGARRDGSARPNANVRRDDAGRDDAGRTDTGEGSAGDGTAPASTPAAPLARWWAQRVAVLTDGPAEEAPSGAPAGRAPELLRAVARHTRSGDRDELRRELARVAPPVGLDLAALTPSLLHSLAGELLGHQPRGADLAELRRATGEKIHTLLPALPPDVVDAQLSRVCRVPPPHRSGAPDHPTDSAVTGAVLVGALLARLGRDPDSLDAASGAHD